MLIAGFVLLLVIGGLVALRGSAKAGMPDEATLQRARQRARDADGQGEGDGD
jgi:hypothetical protein